MIEVIEKMKEGTEIANRKNNYNEQEIALERNENWQSFAFINSGRKHLPRTRNRCTQANGYCGCTTYG